MIDLVKINTFLIAAEYLNFSIAAKHLNITQPTVSHHIQTLEQALLVELFDRSGQDLRLTEAGHLLLPWARKLVNDCAEIEQIMASIDHQTAGHIRIACSTSTGKYVLPLLAGRFRTQYPAVRISICPCTATKVALRLLDAEANIGIVSSELYTKEVESQKFFVDHFILIVSPEHRWAARPEVELTELVDVPFIMREPTSGARRVTLTELAKYDISLDDLNIFMEIGNPEAIVKTVEAGFGVSIVSRVVAAWALELNRVVQVPIARNSLHRSVYMVRQAHQQHNRAVEAFWSFVHDVSNTDLLDLAKAS